jgi:DNA-binding transcriptional regulator YdaS (Cro superfamily)
MNLLCRITVALCTTWLCSATALAAPRAPICTGTDGSSAQDLAKQVSQYPSYSLLRQRLGAPLSCSVEKVESRRTITVRFPKGGSLTASDDTTLESSSQKVVLPKSAKVSSTKALAVLRATERQAAAPDGCGIDWSKIGRGRNAGTVDAEVEGTSCNCKARLGTNGQLVLRLGFSLAC